ncbi:TIGR03899 family protein [Shewanella gelidii]|nr:TIGR03899 family protein [Shewanella gelidii]MCL1096845.1 TIGR03899 family protein [Shewanella gelidii]
MSQEAEFEISETETTNSSLDVSARKKALLLGRQLGLVSDDNYKGANASIIERTQHRQQRLLNQYQLNLETVYKLALSYTSSDVTGVDLDPDWSHQFFQMAEQIHNRKMQDLWARILASEIASPGNFSLRSLALLQQLTHREAQILEKALGMSVRVNKENRLKLISGYRISGGLGRLFRKSPATSLALSQFGLPYSNILTLVDAGILHRSEFETGLLNRKEPITLTMMDQQIHLRPKSEHLLFSYYRFTPIGDELSQLIQPKFDLEYLRSLKAQFSQDFVIS